MLGSATNAVPKQALAAGPRRPRRDFERRRPRTGLPYHFPATVRVPDPGCQGVLCVRLASAPALARPLS